MLAVGRPDLVLRSFRGRYVFGRIDASIHIDHASRRMKIVYLDHQILIDRAGWATVRALSDAKEIRVLISSWSIREIAQAEGEREERAAFLESIRPLYVHDMQILQRLETVSFLNEELFGGARTPFSMFSETFADFLLLNFLVRTRSDYALSDYFRSEGRVAGDIVDIGKNEHAEAMRTLLADPERAHQVEERTNHMQMANLIPRVNARGEPWEPSEIAEILVFCHDHRQELLRACPAVFAEDALSRARLRDRRRKPRTSDTADLFHSVAALAYADVFVTADGWANDRAGEAQLAMRRTGTRAADVLRSLTELVDHIAALRKPIAP
jgi:hypothetical protein